MKAHSFLRAGILLGALGILAACGCRKRLAPPALPAIPSDAAQKAIETYDTEKRGFLDAAALEKAPGLKAAFPGSSHVTADDIAARIAQWKKSGVGRVWFRIMVKHNGAPLPGAKVTLVAEPFLGSQFVPATGLTDQNGEAAPAVPVSGPDDAHGVPAGFYRVQITKDGENIPARYNTETILGLEVFAQEGIAAPLDLQY
jgi:hypothetical protein